jgi:uncharacterized repeat protein (TIGR03803 family)
MKTQLQKYVFWLNVILGFYFTTVNSQYTEFYGVTAKGGEFNNGTIFKTDGDGNNLNVLYSFPVKNEGILPIGNLCTATNGKYYGITQSGGENDRGVIYEWDPTNNAYVVKFEFNNDSIGKKPAGSLILASNGKLYAMTHYGGSYGGGVIFEWDPQTNTYTKKFDFASSTARNPSGSLIQADNGKFYGMTVNGGEYDAGVLFEWDRTTNTYSDKFDFGECYCADVGIVTGKNPVGALIEATNGKMYGMTSGGGEFGKGVLFNWDPDSNKYSKIFDFNGENGSKPNGSLIMASNGMLYGVTENGGDSGGGVLFEWDPSTDTIVKKFDFTGVENGSAPSGPLIQAQNGKLYGVTASSGSHYNGVLFEWDPTTNTYKKELDFDGVEKGAKPVSLTLADNNRLIGITSEGGINNSGVLFEWDIISESFTKKIEFNICENGSDPIGSLVQVDNDKLYGTTYSGGKYGCGVLFEWNILSKTFIKKADFNRKENGCRPKGSLILEDNGKLIGLTDRIRSDTAAIFEWDPYANVLSKKFDFRSVENGEFPVGSLLKAKDGKIYGMTVNEGEYDAGVLFEWDPSTNTFIKKFDFYGDERGGFPSFSLIQADNGKFYGITQGGGTHGGGVIFEWNPTTNTYMKKFDFLGDHLFNHLCSPLIQADNGKFYGRLSSNFEVDEGTIYEWDSTANITIKRTEGLDLYLAPDYGSPMLQADNGKIYGTSSGGGTYGEGTLFEWDPVTNAFKTKNYFNTTNGSIPSGGLIEVKQLLSSILNEQTCNSFTSPSGKYTWKESGVYKDTIPSTAGYDSIIIVNLTIISSDASVTQNQSVLTANAAGAAYQWINCDNGDTPIEGESNQTFTATTDGNYAVIVNENGCIDTSVCFTVNITGLLNNTFNHNITLYPNPTDGSFSIDLGRIYPNAEITITELNGRIIRKDNMINSRFKDLYISESPGMYLLIITSGNKKAIFKISKN